MSEYIVGVDDDFIGLPLSFANPVNDNAISRTGTWPAIGGDPRSTSGSSKRFVDMNFCCNIADLKNISAPQVFIYLVLIALILPSIGGVSLDKLLEGNSSHYNWDCIFLPDNGAFFVRYVISQALLCNLLVRDRVQHNTSPQDKLMTI